MAARGKKKEEEEEVLSEEEEEEETEENEEEAEDITKPDVFTKYKTAGDIVNRICTLTV
jgi:hypothetical protein